MNVSPTAVGCEKPPSTVWFTETAAFGDAPASYGTSGPGAASHVVNPLNPLMLEWFDTHMS